MSYRSYVTETISLPSFVAQEIVKLQYGQQDELEEYVNSYCYENNYLTRGVEKFHAYDGTLSLFVDLPKEQNENTIAIVCIVIADWYRQQGSRLI